jgi:hypothetical protein
MTSGNGRSAHPGHPCGACTPGGARLSMGQLSYASRRLLSDLTERLLYLTL